MAQKYRPLPVHTNRLWNILLARPDRVLHRSRFSELLSHFTYYVDIQLNEINEKDKLPADDVSKPSSQKGANHSARYEESSR